MRTIYLTTLIALIALLGGQQSFAAAEAVSRDQQLRNILLELINANFFHKKEIIANMPQVLENRIVSYEKITQLLKAGANPNYIPIPPTPAQVKGQPQLQKEFYHGKYKDAYNLYLICQCEFEKLLDIYKEENKAIYNTPSYKKFLIDSTYDVQDAFTTAIAQKLELPPPSYEAQAESKVVVEQSELARDGWACNICTLLNNPAAKICDICRTPKPVAPGGL